MAADCVFCQIIEGKIPCCRIYEDAHVLAFLDINPISRGHTLLVPKRHFSTLDECPADVVASLIRPMAPIAKAVVSVTSALGYNVLNNNGRCAGQLVDHVHFHIIPRHPDDGVFNRWPSGQYADGEIDTMAQDIRDRLQTF